MSQKPPKDIAGFIFDVDGCVARGNQALPGVPETLAHLRARGIRCAFMTNENMSTRSQVVAKLVAMGIPCTAEDVVTAAMVAAEVTRALYLLNKMGRNYDVSQEAPRLRTVARSAMRSARDGICEAPETRSWM